MIWGPKESYALYWTAINDTVRSTVFCLATDQSIDLIAKFMLQPRLTSTSHVGQPSFAK